MARALPTERRTRHVRGSTIWVAAAAALVAHGMVLGTVHALGLSLIGHRADGAALAKAAAAAEAVELNLSCAGNAMFATSGRTALCFAPWIGDVERCLGDAEMSLWMDLSSCQARNDRTTAVAILDRIPVEKLKQIDPERLLEEAPVPRTQPPPPPVPPQPQLAAAPPPPPPPPPPRQQLPQQVVETVKPSEEKEPENARFLSEFNTSVEKQKVSRGARNEPMVAKAKPEELTPKDKPQAEPQARPQPDRMPGKSEQAPDVPGHLSMRSPGVKAPAEADQEATHRGSLTGAAGPAGDGYTMRKGDGAIDQQRKERSEVARGDAGAGGGVPQVPNLKASNEVLERVLGGGSVDRLDDVENGDETSLSSKRWVYAAFFNRVKRQVAQNWEPVSVWRRRDPTGTVYGFKTRVTEVRVSLSPRGDVAKLVVTSPSGVIELDDEAVRAVRAAGPFPNPPDGLIQKDNLITFPFGFSFEIGAQHISWRMPTAM